MHSPQCVLPLAATLGEGPFWSASERALWFVDIKQRRIHRYSENTGEQRSWTSPEEIGFLVPVKDGRYLAGLKSGLYRFDPATGSFTLLTLVDSDHADNRLNDACVDTAGRLWFGTMDNAEQRATGSLYRFDRNGLQRCDSGYVITNGPAISPDSRQLYHVDTLQRAIYCFDLSHNGCLSNRRVFIHIDLPDAYPDGPVIDASGCLWIGLYGGWSVRRYSPEGKLLETIAVPAANCTKIAFGGDDLRTLYITTARKGLTEQQLAQQPLAGGLFGLRVDTPGLPQYEVHLPA